MSDAPPYLVAMCEGEHCVPIAAISDPNRRDGDPTAAHVSLVATLTVIAARLRDKGVLGRLILLNGETGEMIATRRVWP